MASALSEALERALNAWLQLDPEGARAFSELEGKAIEIELSGVGLSLYVLPAQDRIRIAEKFDGQVDTRLCGTPIALAKLGVPITLGKTAFPDDVRIEGDIETGQRFKRLLDRIEVDWEEPLSRITGDVVAHQVGNAVRKTGQWASHTFDTLCQNLSEQLKEEARLVPARIELENFYADIDQLRMAADRLEARIQHLSTHRQP